MQTPNGMLLRVVKKIAFYLMLVSLWELFYVLGVERFRVWKPYAFPSPAGVLETLAQLAGDHTLGIAVLTSMKRMCLGYLISLFIGIGLGFLIVRFRYMDENLGPLILGLQTLPNICWLPFAILWYGLNESAIIFVVAVGSAFAITITVESGVKSINPLYIKAAKTMGAKGFNLYRHVIVPATLPYIVSGMKQGWSFAWRALMAGEMLSASVGLGQLLMTGREFSDINQVASVMIVIIVIGLGIDRLVFGRVEMLVRRRWGLYGA